VERKWEQEDIIREENFVKQITHQQQEKVQQLTGNTSNSLAYVPEKTYQNLPANIE
jgi:hypothetical protein